MSGLIRGAISTLALATLFAVPSAGLAALVIDLPDVTVFSDNVLPRSVL